MAGGTLSLTGNTNGQDVLSYNPQITFFKKVYKRHTNFGIETSRQNSIDRQVNFGTTSEIRIDKKGSLITDMHFEFTLPPATGDGVVDERVDEPVPINPTAGPGQNIGCVDNFRGYARWVNAVGFAIINEIKLKFGTQDVDTHTGLWYDVWNELTDPNRKEWSLVGKVDESTESRKGESDRDFSRYYVPLKFYFNRNPGLAIPIFLLNDNELRINISLNTLESLLLFNRRGDINPVINQRSISNFRFYATYVFLEPYEESRIRNSLPSEYIAETLKIEDNLTTGGTGTQPTGLRFDSPVKEFIWIFRHPDRIVSGSITNIPQESFPNDDDIRANDIFNYSSHGTNDSLSYGTNDPFDTLTMTIGTKERFETTDATFFRTIQPYKYHSNVPGGITGNNKKKYIYVYSFALNPEEYQPSGSFNFSLKDDTVGFNFAGPATRQPAGTVFRGMDDYDLTIFAVRYQYIKFDVSGRATVSSLPAKASFNEARDAQAAVQTAARDAEAEGRDVQEAIRRTREDIRQAGLSSSAGVQQEIKRRYAVEVPYIYDQSLGKKKWSGQQGEFFQRQKDADLGKDSKQIKKDIF